MKEIGFISSRTNRAGFLSLVEPLLVILTVCPVPGTVKDFSGVCENMEDKNPYGLVKVT